MTDYTDVATVKGAVGKTLTVHDADITRVITAISRLIDKTTNRPDGFVAPGTASIRYYAGRGESYLRIDETPEITGVAVKAASSDTAYTSWDADDWIAFSGDPLSPDYNHTPYTSIMAAWGTGLLFTAGWLDEEASWSGNRGSLSRTRRKVTAPPTVKVTAKWGYSLTVPPQIEEVCVIESARLVKQAESNYADSMLNETLGRMIMVAQLHPTSVKMLERFKRVSVG